MRLHLPQCYFLLVQNTIPKFWFRAILNHSAHMAGNGSEDLPAATKAAIEYQESIFAQGSVLQDEFYNVLPERVDAAPGTLLKVEAATDTSRYDLPPATALSRILYQSKTLQGSAVPASACILWPYHPRVQPDGTYPLVAWGHGACGFYPNAAPSHIKSLHQHWQAPFPLALQGYAVVAPDYVGLGVARTADGKEIKHEFLANLAAANDIVYAVQAAQEAFPNLSSDFVVIGHSQGGGAAWAVAQQQAKSPIKGYLGAVAVNPVTNMLELPTTDNPIIPALAVYTVPAMQKLYPEFDPKDFFTEEGWNRYRLDQQVGGCASVSSTLMIGPQVLRDDWRANPYLKQYYNLTANGGIEIANPLLVIQGENDPHLNVNTTTSAVEKTIKNFPDSQLQFITLPGIAHDPAMYAAQRLWLDWIADRFKGVQVKAGYEKLSSSRELFARPLNTYQSEATWIIRTADAPYQLF